MVFYPEHVEREHDPTYKLFQKFRREHKDTAKCWFGEQRGSFNECTLDLPLELHHSIIEHALTGAIDTPEEFEWFSDDYWGVDTPEELAAWVNSARQNLIFLCQYHHRGAGGIHVLSAADWAASQYIHKMTGKVK